MICADFLGEQFLDLDRNSELRIRKLTVEPDCNAILTTNYCSGTARCGCQQTEVMAGNTGLLGTWDEQEGAIVNIGIGKGSEGTNLGRSRRGGCDVMLGHHEGTLRRRKHGRVPTPATSSVFGSKTDYDYLKNIGSSNQTTSITDGNDR
jgi:hypothetical protein